jgi:hypothetical protein
MLVWQFGVSGDRANRGIYLDAFSVDPNTGAYIKHVGAEDTLEMQVEIRNSRERAYEAMLYVKYDHEELDRPIIGKTVLSFNHLYTHLFTHIQQNASVVDEGGKTAGQIAYAFGNPFDAGAKLVFTLRFKLSRGKSHAIGRPLEFAIVSNS